MPVIRTIGDYSNVPRPGGGAAVHPAGSHAVGYAQPQGVVHLPPTGEGATASLMRPEDPTDTSMSQRCFPRARWMSATTFISIFEGFMFFVTLVVGATRFGGAFVKDNPMLGPSTQCLLFMGGKYLPFILDGQIYRLVTPIWLHAGVIHILSNLFFQCRFGFALETRWGTPMFCLVYLITGVGGVLLSCVWGPDSVSVGASGALFGLLGADISYLAYNWDNIPDNKREAFWLGIIIALNMLFGLGPNSHVDNSAHFGGLLTGLFFGGVALKPVTVRDYEGIIRGFAGMIWVSMFVAWCIIIFSEKR
eukprot:gb/GEZN01004854.1/.p1 GENE.gb/GEZN01004854.1/~~gb/GEZN01004854.1/.p1  ORF type:complete len:306 (-),score=19.63 gb/GEZN01004854.1/:682-1599(-)